MRRGTTRPGGTSGSPPPDGIQWSVVRAWLCNAPRLDGTLCIDSPRCPAATQCPRLHALSRHTGRARRLARGDEARGRPDPCASHAGRRAVARDSTDTGDGRWRPTRRSRPSRFGRRRDRRSPPVAPAALYDEGWVARTLGLAPSLQGTTDGQRRLGCRPAAHGITR